MEPNSIRSIDIVLLIIAVLLLVLWIVNLVRLSLARAQVRKRNERIWNLYRDHAAMRQRLRRETDLREKAEDDLLSARAANDALVGRPVESGTVEAPQPDLRARLDDAMQTSHRYLRASFGRDDLAELIHVDKKEIDALFKDGSPADYIAAWRLDYAIALMQDEPVKDTATLASESGFPSEKALDRTCRNRLSMSFEELRNAMNL
ncbi:MAG: hypothetical protein IJ652_00780 [Bacteroidales bacterium]|nr:hypothetical protein [Bacteroidales bacterium]